MCQVLGRTTKGKIVLVRIAALSIALTLAACTQDMRAAGNRTMITQDEALWKAVGGAGNLDGFLENLDSQMADDWAK